MTEWKAVIGPAGMKDSEVNTLNQAINEALVDPEFIEAMRREGSDPVGGSSEEFRKLLEDEYVPLIFAYGETLKYSLGEKFYEDVKERLLEENLIFLEELIVSKLISSS